MARTLIFDLMTNFRNDKMGFKLSEIGGRIILIFEKWGLFVLFRLSGW